jgi:hypothetical protein
MYGSSSSQLVELEVLDNFAFDVKIAFPSHPRPSVVSDLTDNYTTA